MPSATETTETTVLSEARHGGSVAVLTLNRVHLHNAISTQMGLRLIQVLDEIAQRPEVRVVILTGAGERAFCSGGDLKERMGMSPDEWEAQHRIFEAALNRLRRLSKPIFAAVNGIAVGGGCELAMSTDFIICSDNATFGQPEVTRGIMPGSGGTQFLPRYIPRGRALELLMTGGMIDADEAHRWGLVNHVVPLQELMRTAENIALTIAANSPIAVQQAKRSAKMGLEQPIEQAIDIELECYRRLVNHPDRFEGVTAFAEKRKPRFQDAL